MYKRLHLNTDYSFDFNGNVKKLDKNIDNVGFIEIEIDGKIYNFCKKWLGLIAHYEVSLPLNEVLKIDFVKCTFKVLAIRCGMLMVFKKPILVDKEFRVIPGFTGFVINKTGSVISTRYGRLLKPSIGPYGYPYVNLYDADKSRWRSVCIHILLARAFIPKNHITCDWHFVNHIDGNKLNMSLSNLEWTTSLKNNIHAVNTGLRKDNKPCMVRNIHTGEITTHQSVKRALLHIGVKGSWVPIKRSHAGDLIPKIFLNKYEIKLADDNTDWFYSESNRPEKYNLLTKVFQIFEIATKTVRETSLLKQLHVLTGVTESKINRSIRSLGTIAFDGFAFREKSNRDWPEEFDKSNFSKQRSFIAENYSSGEKVIFDSLRKAVAYFNIDKRTFKNKLLKNKSINGWHLSEIH